MEEGVDERRRGADEQDRAVERLEEAARKDPGGTYGLRAAELLSRFPK